MSTPRAWLAVAGCAGACLAATACTPEAERGELRLEPPALSRPASRHPHRALEYRFDPTSHVNLALGGREGRLLGELPVASGRLWLDPSDLSSTRAELTFDLAAIRLWDSRSNPAPEGAGRSTLTEQSLDWLQISREQDVEARPELRYARFTLLGIGSSSSNDLEATPTVRSEQPDAVARRVRLRASGELELHGHRLPQTAILSATFEWTRPAEPGAAPSRIRLETTEPLSIDLPAFRVVPRNSRGAVLAEIRRLRQSPVQVRGRWLAELAGSPPTTATRGAGPAAREP